MESLQHFAYLDAGTGSLIIQSLVGVVAGIAVFGRKFLANVGGKISRVFNKADKKQD